MFDYLAAFLRELLKNSEHNHLDVNILGENGRNSNRPESVLSVTPFWSAVWHIQEKLFKSDLMFYYLIEDISWVGGKDDVVNKVFNSQPTGLIPDV